MRRKATTVIVLTLLVAAIAAPIVFLAGARVVGWVFDAKSFIEDQSPFLQGAAVVTALAAFLISRFTLRRAKSIRRDEAVLQPIGIPELRKSLGATGGKVAWVDRGIVGPKDLRQSRYLAILGPIKSGKTREAIELLRAAVDTELVSNTTVYVPGPALIRSSAADQSVNPPGI